ncbi:hypothetical protein [Micromonospora sp. NBC_01796]|uniref:hypothetical protein n=1 Tax=Micromonospora sp. NBC_01796 TaxID=2975987 RepID=UPI002DD96AAB|nr:hypothetical protein [Micromonospora sp. NBC_01796]WSA83357.1 hypothetical protein OIE47_23470 [Micromonospora sp. NBC_01796]
MAATDPTSARTEAERLVATALAAVRLGTSGRAGGFGPLGDLITGVLGHSGADRPTGGGTSRTGATGHHGGPGSTTGTPGGAFATGSPECCVCPICRTITALRDPSPEFAERLATGAGDFAAGLASLLRALSTATTSPPAPGTPSAHPGTPPPPTGTPAGSPDAAAPATGTPPEAPDGPADPAPTHPAAPAARPGADDEVWRGATRTVHDSWPAPERDVWAAATRAATETRTDRTTPPADAAGTTGASARPAPPSSTGAGPGAEATGPAPVVPAARIPGEPALADGDTGDGG